MPGELTTLVLSYHPLIVVDTVEEERLEGSLAGAAAELGMPLMEWSVTAGLAAHGEKSPVYGTSDPKQALSYVVEAEAEAIYWLKDFAPLLTTPQIQRQLRDVAERLGEARTRTTVVLSGADVRLPEEIASSAAEYEMPMPSETEYAQTIDWVLASVSWRGGSPIDASALDRGALIRAVTGMTVAQARQAIAYAALNDGRLSPEDVSVIVEMKAKMIAEGGLLEYFPAEATAPSLGGFEGLKAWLDDAQMGFSEQARSLNLAPPKGILIVGVQGCGKSLAARVISRGWQLPLLKLEAARLYEGLIGQTEKNFRKATAMAEALAPDVLWIDEIEKGFAPTGGDADAGLSQRVFGAFLTWLQEKRRDVFVVATANDLSKLPPELLRKGRFDEIFFADLPDPTARREIWEIQLRAHNQDPAALDLAQLVAASDGFSGAEIEQCVVSSLYVALRDGAALTPQTLIDALESSPPLSVTRRDDVEALRARAADFRPA